MPSSYHVDTLRLVLGLVFLLMASFRDMRTRKVPNQLWFGMLALGLVILEGEFILKEAPWVLMLTPIPVLIIFLSIFSEGEILPDHLSPGANMGLTIGLNLLAFAILWYEGDQTGYSLDWIKVIHIPIMLILAYLLYIVRALHGGADAKALMGLAVLVPFYPLLEGLPIIDSPEAMQIIFPFTFVILINSAIVTLLVPLGYAVYNASRGDTDVRMFFGYMLPLEEVPHRFVWLMEKVVDGEVVTFLFPKRGEKKGLKKELKALRKAGVDRVWVNPKIPFMVPMFFGFLVSFLVGNLVFGLVAGIISM